MLLNGDYPFSHGDSEGGQYVAMDGLGRFSLKKVVKKIKKGVKSVAMLPVTATKKLVINPLKRSKKLRKVALVAAGGAALYFGGPLAAKGIKALVGAKSASAPVAAPTPDYAPAQSEGADTTGYEGQEAATIAPPTPDQGTLISPSMFDSAANIARAVGSAAPKRKPRASQDAQTAPAPEASITDQLFTGKNVMLLGAAGLLAAYLFSKKGR